MSYPPSQHSTENHDPVEPRDFLGNINHFSKPTVEQQTGPSRASSKSSRPSLTIPRPAKFAEVINTPVEAKATAVTMTRPAPSDVGFGYINQGENAAPAGPKRPAPLPLKSALKSSNKQSDEKAVVSPTFTVNPLSPTWREEEKLDKEEQKLDKQQAKDLKVKFRVRVAKVLLRGVNFSCSLIVLAMLSSSLTIFNASKSLPPRNGLPPWAANTKTWPQMVLLIIACISLALAVVVMCGQWCGGRRRAEKAAIYYTVFAVGSFAFSTIMWALAAGILNSSRANGKGKDIWGWSCVNNQRKDLFKDDINYDVICRMQNWSLICCIIEVVVEVITIMVYGITFYRFASKRRLAKSMAFRDNARNELYLARLRETDPEAYALASPPLSPLASPRGPLSPRFPIGSEPVKSKKAEEAGFAGFNFTSPGAQSVIAKPKPAASFTLQAPPPSRGKTAQSISSNGSSTIVSQSAVARSTTPTMDGPLSPHMPAAPGERVYESVPIPTAYLASPTFAPATMTFPHEK